MASSVHFLGVTFYAIFASGEKQHWAEAAEDAQMMDWRSPTDVPENIFQSGYDYGNEEGGDLEASVRQPLKESAPESNNAHSSNPLRPYMTETFRASNRSEAEDDAYHQAY